VAVQGSALGGAPTTVLCAGRRSGRVRWRFLACRRSELALDPAIVHAARSDAEWTCAGLAVEARDVLASLTARAEQLRRTVLAAAEIGWADVGHVVAMEAPALAADAERLGVLLATLGVEDGIGATGRIAQALADAQADPVAALEVVLANAALLATLVS
jgi:hypothetical protein